jgi:hypothetical protein
MAALDEEYDFDTYAGRKLYSYLYDEHFENIQVEVTAHHLIYGEARQVDVFNWLKKIEVIAGKLENLFRDYPGGYPAFADDFRKFFLDPGVSPTRPSSCVKGCDPTMTDRPDRELL